MEVILKRDVRLLGNRGEIVNVKSGYARNYLIPLGLAEKATEEAKQKIERERQREEREAMERRRQLEELAARLEKSSCTIVAQANEQGHLFGSVTAAEIAQAFAEEGIDLTPEQVLLEAPIKEIGVYGFEVKLHPEVTVTTKAWVVKA